MNRFPSAAVIAATAEREVVLGGARVSILAGSAETGGACAVLSYWMPGRYPGPPAHVHPGFDEIFTVVEGRLTVELDGKLTVAGPGEAVVVPGTVGHTFANRAPEPVRVVIFLTPGGFESYFGELVPLVSGDAPDLEAIGALAQRYGVENVGPPLSV